MKWLFIPAATALSLAVATPALAAPDAGSGRQVAQSDQQLPQNDQREREKRRGQGTQKEQRQQMQPRQMPPQQMPPPQMQPPQMQRQQMPPRQMQPQQMPPRQMPPQQMQPRQMQRPQIQRPQIQRPQRYDWRNYRPGRRPPDWERHRRFDRGAWERNWRSERRHHWQPYHRPSGWFYRRWVFGMILPTLFWSRDYWIDSYWRFGLPDPPYGYVWVRYGNDALLVNVETGEILRVVYGVFY